MKKVLFNILKITGLTVGSVLLMLFLLPALFPGAVTGKIKQWTNESITGELNFSRIRLSFFKHFPSLTLTLYDFSLTGSEPFAADTLMAGRSISFGINLASLFAETMVVDQFFVEGALINVQVDEQGRANYNIYQGSADTAAAASDTTDTRLNINGIFINHSRLVYHDRSIPLIIRADGFRYEGRGNLADSQFDLQSNLHADSLDFIFDGTAYVQRKRLEADLLTGINTSSLTFRFARNNLLINKLPVDFTGSMSILRDGYDIDLKVISGVTDFGNIFSALPPDYDDWFAGTQFGGQSRITVEMGGSYRAATGQAPDLSVGLWVHDGSIQYQATPAPLEHVWINGAVHLPGLNPDSIRLAVDTLNFQLADGKTEASLLLKGLDRPFVKASIVSNINLRLLDQALGLSNLDLQGELSLNGQLEGVYRTGQNPGRIRPDTVITAIPAFRLNAELSGGYFHYQDLPLALEQLAGRVQSACASGNPKDLSFSVSGFTAKLGEGQIAADLSAEIPENRIKAAVKARLQLDDLARAVPLEGYELAGALVADLSADGVFNPGNRSFPAANGAVQLTGGRILTPYYPHPIEQVQVSAGIQADRYDNLAVSLQPVSFVFEGQPFQVTARVSNPGNLQYRIRADGALDLGRIYQVFAMQGYGVAGRLQAHLDLNGAAADPLSGRNTGELRVSDLVLRSDDYPAPFLIPKATLRFDQDKAWLDQTLLRYGRNEFNLKGYTRNFIAHAIDGSTLLGSLSVSCPSLYIDDFMVFAPPPDLPPQSAAPAEGVVQLPADMDLSLEASVKEILYGQTRLEDFSGKVTLKDGRMALEQIQAGMAGATFHISGDYTPEDLRRAAFSAAFKADSFDVRRAYNEIPLFREMAPAAAKAEGLVSVNYELAGQLNAQMAPVYPGIKGGGELRLEQVRVSGLKLFGAVAKATQKDSINNPDLKAVVMKSAVANNIITIERTRMKVFGFRPRIEGQVSLDGRLNLRFRLGLPPFGALGIPMTITGLSSDPKVEIRRGKEEDELEEVEERE